MGVHAVVPTDNGTAVFLGNEEKKFVIYMEQSVGTAISMFIHGVAKPRPLTHDLIVLLLTSFGASVDRVIINKYQEDVFYARLILVAENEVMERKVVEIDARPSDCIALACQQNAPMYVTKEVWDIVEDMTEVLEKLGSEKADDEEDEENEDN